MEDSAKTSIARCVRWRTVQRPASNAADAAMARASRAARSRRAMTTMEDSTITRIAGGVRGRLL